MIEKKERIRNVEKEIVKNIEITKIKDFRNHPFRVELDLPMLELMDSIEQHGILTPLIVRENPNGNYEIISGHRRKYAAQVMGYTHIPVMIRSMTDVEATIAMADSNLQREVIRPSEKGLAYKMKQDAIVKQRNKKYGGEDRELYKGKRTIDLICPEYGDSPKQVQRYIKLLDLIPELLDKVDDGIIGFTPAYEISYLTENEQRMFIDAMDYTQALPTLSQAQKIRKLSKNGKVSLEDMRDILGDIKKDYQERVMFKTKQLRGYFPQYYTTTMMKRKILELLDNWKNKKIDQEEETICAKL